MCAHHTVSGGRLQGRNEYARAATAEVVKEEFCSVLRPTSIGNMPLPLHYRPPTYVSFCRSLFNGSYLLAICKHIQVDLSTTGDSI